MGEAINITLPETSDPILYHYYKGLENRTFFINDVINEDTIDTVAIPLLLADKVSNDPITIYINTPGGSISDGFNLTDVISNLQSPTTIIVLGYAYSMGMYFLMAGANKPHIKRLCHRFSTGLMHGGNSLIQGTSSQVKDYYKFAERFDAKIKSFVLQNSKFTESEYDKIEREELYLTAEDMLEKGLIDEII